MAVSETERLNEWLATKYAEQLDLMPMTKTYIGIKDEDYGKIDDYSAAGADAVITWRALSIGELTASFDYDALDETGRDSYDLWAYINRQAIEANAFRDRAFLFHQFGSAHSGLPQFLMSRHDVATGEDMHAYVSRIGEIGRAIRQLVERSRRYAAGGVRPPYFAFDRVIREAQALISGAPFDDTNGASPLWADALRKIGELETEGTIDAQGATELRAATERALVEAFAPAYRDLVAWQQEDRVNALADADQATGVGVLSEGAAYYDERLAFYTTTSLTAEEIHEVGRRNVARLHDEMREFQASVGLAGSLRDFFQLLQTAKDDPRFYYPNTDAGRAAYLEASTVAIDNIKAQLPAFFGMLPRADVVVKRVEPFREQPGAAAHYFSSSPDGTRPGIFYAHLLDMMAMPKHRLENLAYHEALPGHHLQIALANELDGIPEFRKRARATAFTEGWGLYAERLAKEVPGTYQDPFGDFGRLRGELWRAVRLVVDTGLHAKGWSEQTGDRVLPRECAGRAESGRVRGAPLHRSPRAGDGLHGRHVEAARVARPCRGGARRCVRHPLVPRHRARSGGDAARSAGAENRSLDRGVELIDGRASRGVHDTSARGFR